MLRVDDQLRDPNACDGTGISKARTRNSSFRIDSSHEHSAESGTSSQTKGKAHEAARRVAGQASQERGIGPRIGAEAALRAHSEMSDCSKWTPRAFKKGTRQRACVSDAARRTTKACASEALRWMTVGAYVDGSRKPTIWRFPGRSTVASVGRCSIVTRTGVRPGTSCESPAPLVFPPRSRRSFA